MIIRKLFKLNSTSYTNPDSLLNEYKASGSLNIGEVYEKYLRSQLQLLNDFSTEVFILKNDYRKPSYLLFDRSPMDFYILTKCGIDYIKNALPINELNDICQKLLILIKENAEYNTELLFNKIIVTPPWNVDENNNSLKDGIRDQYLSKFYSGENWYNRDKFINLQNCIVYNIDKESTSIEDRLIFIKSLLK